MRSLLIIPPDQEERIALAQDSGADALVLDLAGAEGASLARARRAAADVTRAHLQARSPARLLVRIHPPTSPLMLSDLEAVMAAEPDGILMPCGAADPDIRLLDARIAVCEALHGIEDGSTRMLVELAASAAAGLTAAAFVPASRRRIGLVYGSPSSSEQPGPHAGEGSAEASRWGWSLSLIAARTAGLPVYLGAAGADTGDLESRCRAARAEGFSGMVAAEPAEVETVNRIFGAARN